MAEWSQDPVNISSVLLRIFIFRDFDVKIETHKNIKIKIINSLFLLAAYRWALLSMVCGGGSLQMPLHGFS